MWKPKSRKNHGEEEEIHYNQLIYKNYKDCLECLWIRVDCGSIGRSWCLVQRKDPESIYNEMLVVNESWQDLCNCTTFMYRFAERPWLWALDYWDYIQGISSLSTTVCFEFKSVTPRFLKCAKTARDKRQRCIYVRRLPHIYALSLI